MIHRQKRIITRLPILLLCMVVTVAILFVFVIKNNSISEETITNDIKTEIEENYGSFDENKIVLYDTNANQAKKIAKAIGAKLRITANGDFATLTLPDGVTVKDICDNEEYSEYLKYFDLDYYASASEAEESEEDTYERLTSAPDYDISDTLYNYQTYLNYLNLKDTWDYYTGTSVTVAIIDTGIDTDHPEFSGKISTWSYNATADKIVKDYGNDWSLIEDEQGHGTAVAGVIAAAMDGLGIVGIAPNVELLIIKVECDESGQFYNSSDLVFGLYYAIERNVDVVNMSFGGGGDFSSPAKLAVDSDIICVAAAGNEASPVVSSPAYLDNVIGVGALENGSWNLASYSNYGEGIDVVAPGTVYTCAIGGGYRKIEGTSFACPIVASAIALYRQQNLRAEYDDVKALLHASSYDLGDLGKDFVYGFGALDIYAFLLEERCTVTFNHLTDELDDVEQVFIKNHPLQELPEPDRNYAVFNRWNYDIYCTEEVNYYKDKWSGDLTLYANWVNEDDGVPYTYVELDDGTIEIRSYTGHRKFITIPDYIDGKKVTSIGEEAFSGNEKLRMVNLPKHLTKIRRRAFYDCKKLTSITIPNGVTIIDKEAFANDSKITEIIFESNSNLEVIGERAFAFTGLKNFTVPKKVTKLDGSAFYGTTKMKAYTVEKGNSAFFAIDGVLFNKTISTIIAYPANGSSEYAIPDSVRLIGDSAFAYSKIKSINFNQVTKIEKFAFVYSNLQSVNLPDSITSIGIGSFLGCQYLKVVTIGKGLSVIPGSMSSGAFEFCPSLTSVTIPNTVMLIDTEAFANGGLTNVTFETNSILAQIGAGAFSNISITEIEIPKSVSIIEAGAFACCVDLQNVVFENGSSLRKIGAEAFAFCLSLESISLPDSLAILGDYAFMDSALTGTINISKDLVDIGINPFASCRYLTGINVSEENTVYVDFDGVLYAKAPYVINGFDITPNEYALISYPAGKAQQQYTIVDNTNIIEDSAFYGSKILNIIYINNEMQEIHRCAFYDCINLLDMFIPEEVVQISDFAFAKTEKLNSITFDDNSKLTRISLNTFADCGIYSIRIPKNVSSIAQYAFSHCANLSNIVFAGGSKIGSISAYLFEGCDKLDMVVFENGSELTNIQPHAFENCNVRIVDFGDAEITNIGNYAFRYCFNLQSFSIPSTVTSIGRYAFYGDESLTDIVIPVSVEFIGRYAFYTRKNSMNLYFASEILPAKLQERWDEGIKGYYVGVSNVVVNDNWKYTVLNDGNNAIIEYLGSETTIDLNEVDFGGDLVSIGGFCFYGSSVKNIILPNTVSSIQQYAFSFSELESITIPSSVKFIGRYAFDHAKELESVTFGENSQVKSIDKYAFANTDALQTISLPASLEELGSYSFYKSGITSIIFDENIKIEEIKENTFEGSHLTSVTIPNSVTLINHNAFRDSLSLTSVTWGTEKEFMLMSNVFYNTCLSGILSIPDNLVYIGEYSLIGLSHLEGYNVAEANEHYKSIDGVLFNKEGKKIIAFPSNRTGSYTVSEDVETIGFGAFENSKLSSVVFEEDINLLTIGYRAFYNADGLVTINIPSSVISIDYYAFACCDSLTTVNFALDNKLTGIYEGAFYLCKSLKNIIIPDEVIEISDYAFYGCKELKSLPVSNNSKLLLIGDYAFGYTGIEQFKAIESVLEYGNYSFVGIPVKSVNIPFNNEALTLGFGMFADCNKLYEITIPFTGDSYEGDNYWFGYIFGAGNYGANKEYVPESLKIATVTEEVEIIREGTYFNCVNLEKLNIQEWVSWIEPLAFGFIDSSVYSINIDVYEFGKIEGYIIEYNTAGMGHKGVDKVIIEEGIETIPIGAFSSSGVRSVSLPSTLKRIESGAFQGSCISKIDIPSGCTDIAEGAFGGCYYLTYIVLPEGLEIIYSETFHNSGLTSIVLPSTLKEIKSGAFNFENNYIDLKMDLIINNSELTLDFDSLDNGGIAKFAKKIVNKNGDVQLKEEDFEYLDTNDGLRFKVQNGEYTLIGYNGGEDTYELPLTINGKSYNIYKAYGFKNLIIPEGFTEIGDYAFGDLNGDSGLLSVKFPTTLKSIGNFAFASSRLMKVVLNEGLEELGDHVFLNSYCLKEIIFSSTIREIGGCCGCSSLEKVFIANGPESIGGQGFDGCKNLQEIIIPDSIERIEEYAFSGCTNLKYMSIGASLQNMPSLEGCDNLTKIDISESNEYLIEENGIIYNKEKTRIEQILSCPKVLEIPSTIQSIGDGLFYDLYELETVIIPEGITSIGTFRNCPNLTSVTLPNTIYSMGGFDNCGKLQEFIIPDSVVSIGGFRQCASLETIYISKNVSYLVDGFISDCNSIKSIIVDEENPYYYSINNSVVEKATKKLVYGISYIPDDITEIGNHALVNYPYETLIVPEGVRILGAQAIYRGCVNTIVLPSTLEETGIWPFSDCEVVINNSSLDIQFGSYYYDVSYNFKKIVDKDGNVYLRDYINEWIDLETPDHFLYHIINGEYVLYRYNGDEEFVTLPVEYDGHPVTYSRFSGAKNIIFPKELDIWRIQGYAFVDNELEGIYIYADTAFGSYAFYNCNNIKYVYIDANCELDRTCFAYCNEIPRIEIKNVKSISCKVFANWNPWITTEKYYHDGLYILDDFIYDVDENLTELIIPENIIGIASGCLDKCKNLKYVDLGNCTYYSLNNHKLGDLSNLETLIVSDRNIQSITEYFGDMLDYNIPITLKNIVIKNDIYRVSDDYLFGIKDVKVFVDIYKEEVEWSKEYPNWNNKNTVYYKGKWISVDFYEGEDRISTQYYSSADVIRQPFIKDIIDHDYTQAFIGWDLDGDDIVDAFPATSASNITARVVRETIPTEYTVNFYDYNNDLISSTNYHYNDLIVKPDDLVRSGYNFIGWSGYFDGMKATDNLDFYANYVHVGDGHNYTHTHVDATCTHEGYELYTCSICGDEYKEDIVPMLEHKYGEWIIDSDPTCTTDGLKHHECTHCHEVEEVVIPSTGHDYKATVTTEATCEHTGLMIHKCSICGDEVEEVIPLAEHHYEKKVVRKYLLQLIIERVLNVLFGYEGNDGYYFKCSECGHIATIEEASHVASVAGAEHDHALGDWEAISEANCTDPGIMGRKCTICDEIIEIKEVDHNDEHDYQFDSFVWNGTTAQAKYVCIHDNTHIELHNAVVNSSVKTSATCESKGITTYTATYDNHTDSIDLEDIPALGHDLIHHEAHAATCTEIGWEAYDTCSRCNYSTYQEIAALGHNLTHHEAHAATCTEIGWEAYDTCSRCNYSTYHEIPALGHDLHHHDAKAATCTEIGWEAYDTCSRCDYSTYQEIPALGHKASQAVIENNVDPTCLEKGSYDEVVYCSVCHAELSRTHKEVDALGHDLVHHEAKAATCTEIGWEAYDTCSRCNYSTYQEIPALGHDLVHHEAHAATCTEIGWEAYDTCSRCDYSTYQEIPALGHKASQAVIENNVDPTCLEKGSYDEVVYCSVCHTELSRTHKEVDALGHDLHHHEAHAATCTEIGWEAYDACSRCNYSTYQEIPALGHKASQAVIENNVDPTCLEKGSYDEVVYCSVCHEELSRTHKEVDALGHDLVHHDAKAATCTEIGWEAYDTCSRCNYSTYQEIPALGHDLHHHDAKAATCTEIGWEAYDTCSRCDYSTYQEIAALGHKASQAVIENNVDPTCLEKGSYDEVVYCSVCQAELSRTHKETDALGHDLVHHEAHAATCTQIGWEAYDTCSRCNYSTYQEIAALGHKASQAVIENNVDPTCLEKGSYDEVVYCSVCHAELSRTHKEVDALGHDLVHHEAHAATCTQIGWEAYDTCSRCNYSTYQEIPALGHDLVHHEAHAATCTQIGWDAYDTCSRCNYSTYQEIAALGHKASQAVIENNVDPTCLEKGSYDEVVYCSVCGEELSRTHKEVDALGHDLHHHEAHAATCTEIGWEAYDTCSRCNYSTYHEIAALGHDFGEWVITKEATFTEAGIKERHCSRCDEVETQSIDKLIDEKAVAFKNAINEANLNNYSELIELINLYSSIEDKESVSTEVELLIEAINNYNTKVDAINNVSNNTNNIIFSIIGAISSLALVSFIALRINRKENNL